MANERIAYIYVQDTWADWEAGYAMAELNSGRFFQAKGQRVRVRTVGATRDRITTLGGATIVPDVTVDEVSAASAAVLILVGGDTWSEPRHQPVIDKVKELLGAGANVAAICGATAALAEAGVLDNRPHTSNTLAYLKTVAPRYRGHAHYRDDRAVMDGNLITANSAGALLFARHILDRLDVMSSAALAAWYEYFDTGEARHFAALMAALPKPRSP